MGLASFNPAKLTFNLLLLKDFALQTVFSKGYHFDKIKFLSKGESGVDYSGKIKAVLFDLGGTLMKSIFGPPEVIRRILEDSGVTVSLQGIVEAHEANVKAFDAEKMANLGQAYWTKWNLKILRRVGIQKNNEFLARKIDELWWEYDELEAYPDVVETLTQLENRGIKTGIVTNVVERDFKQILRKFPWSKYFAVVVGVDTCKKAKPNPEIFLYTVNQLHVHPDETVFVGDSLKNDYEGAEKAGLRPLLIDREGKFSDKAKTVASLVEVLQHV